MEKEKRSKRNRTKSVNRQGITEDTRDQQPQSQLEQRSEKRQTKI
ncbi:small, acid-soluble spore protein L [Thalassobacillus hwangdonensis]|uniref:Small, acid-soluble spore protein L n=1 Tax=Thalassobacillus hwangdonensis TaxID=546108 RepID=A0ABW3L3L2_9BACI